MAKKAATVFRLFQEAIRGDVQDFTEGSINRAIFLLAVPMILEMAMESLFAIVDIFFVSRLNSSDAVAAVGLTESMLTIVYSIAMGLSMGATAMVSRRVGEKDTAGAAVAGIQAIYIGGALAVISGLAGLLYYKELLILMGASDHVVAIGSGFTKLMFGGNFTIMMLYLINGIFRGAGNAAIAMRSLWIANIINMLLDPLLIFGWGPIPAYGVEGAAISTNVGRMIGVLYQLYFLLEGKGIIRITKQNLVIRWDVIAKLCNISAGGAGQFLISSASWLFLAKIMAYFGSAAVAGYTIAIRVIIFTILPSWGMANASATLVGQNLGAGKPDRAEQSVWKAGFYNMIFLFGIMILFLFLSRSILMFFTTDHQVVESGTRCLQIVALGYIFFGYGMVISQAFNGAGDTRTPTILNFIGFWFFQIPLAYFLALRMDFGPTGLYAAIAIAESAMAVAGIIVFRKGKWKSIKI
jgi:putative MATE family efflux protein